jgi:hypothetical protein
VFGDERKRNELSSHGLQVGSVYQKIELPIPPQTGMHIELRCVGQVIQFINMQRKENGEFMAVCWLEDDTRETDVRYRVDCYRDTGWKVVSENEDAWD